MLDEDEVGALGQAARGADRVDEARLGVGDEELEDHVDMVGLGNHVGDIANRETLLLVGLRDVGHLAGLLTTQVVLLHVGGTSWINPPYYGCGPHHLPIW